MNFFVRAAQRAGDRALHSLGSHTAKGRLRVGFFEDKLHRDWAVYWGETRTTKSWNNFVEFMHVAYGAELDLNLISTDVSSEELDQIIGRVAGLTGACESLFVERVTVASCWR